MNVRFINVAQQELDEAYAWYEAQAQGLGLRLVREAQIAVRRIAVFPESCQEIGPDIRRCLVRRFPYALIYRMADGGIVVLAVMHQHRKPRYWQDRLKLTT